MPNNDTGGPQNKWQFTTVGDSPTDPYANDPGTYIDTAGDPGLANIMAYGGNPGLWQNGQLEDNFSAGNTGMGFLDDAFADLGILGGIGAAGEVTGGALGLGDAAGGTVSVGDLGATTFPGDATLGADAAGVPGADAVGSGLGTGVTGDLATGLTVTAPADAGVDLSGLGADAALGAPLLASLGSQPGAVTDTGATLSPSAEGTPFLAATSGDAGATQLGSLSPDIASSLGIDTGSGDALGIDPNDPMSWDPMQANLDSQSLDPIVPATDTGTAQPPSFLDRVGKYFESPRGLSTAGLLGISGFNALHQPKLPGATQQADTNAATLAQSQLPIINSGGTATPEWAGQKASIDATIDQQIQNQTRALKQAAASSGEGNANSGLVQEQIQTMTAQLNVQRQQLYQQAQAQNVSAALSALSGADSTLTSIGNMELQQSEEAQGLAAQTAELALLLASGTGTKYTGPGAGVALG